VPQSVLIIDDSPEIQQLLEVRLKPEGLRIEHALGAEEGLQKALLLQPDLILLDLDLPSRHGFDLCQNLKADPSTTMIPIIFLTGTSDVEAKVRGFDLGAVDYVTKPFEVAELRARVRAALRTRRYQHMLSARAQLDALTGLWNRAYFDQRLGQEIAAARRYRRTVSLALLDLDHFKNLNDGYGHPFGDQVLQGVGDALSVTLRATDAACRYGGEEFAIIMSDTDLEGGIVAANRIRDELAKMDLRPKGDRVSITASVGLTSSEQFTDRSKLTPAALISAADQALYTAKQAGRDRICSAQDPGAA
jgi:two-component system, cell cycle response regulator